MTEAIGVAAMTANGLMEVVRDIDWRYGMMSSQKVLAKLEPAENTRVTSLQDFA